MKRRTTVATVSLTFTVSLALTPTATLADGFRGGAGGGHVVVSRPAVVRPFVARPFVHRPFVHHHFFRPFIPFGVFAAPVVVYAPPPVYYSPPPVVYSAPFAYSSDSAAYYGPPAAYAARSTLAVAPAPASPPMPTVVEYPHGRYELRGDGVTAPYTWVWIPNPPPPPPPAAPPAAAPPAPPASGSPAPERHTQIYRWMDGQGVTHWTDRWDAVPDQYRAQAKPARPS